MVMLLPSTFGAFSTVATSASCFAKSSSTCLLLAICAISLPRKRNVTFTLSPLQKTIDVKEVRLSPNIDTNDLKTKVNAARKFIEKGNKVKVTLRFRGREMAHVQSSKQILDVFSERMADVAVVDKAPKMEGRSMTMFLTEKR